MFASRANRLPTLAEPVPGRDIEPIKRPGLVSTRNLYHMLLEGHFHCNHFHFLFFSSSASSSKAFKATSEFRCSLLKICTQTGLHARGHRLLLITITALHTLTSHMLIRNATILLATDTFSLYKPNRAQKEAKETDAIQPSFLKTKILHLLKRFNYLGGRAHFL